MRVSDLERFRSNGLCSDGLDEAYDILGDDDYPNFRDMAEVYMAEGGEWQDVIRVIALLTKSREWVWKVVRIAFEKLPEPLNKYAMTLGPSNGVQARNATLTFNRLNHACGNGVFYTVANATDAVYYADLDEDSESVVCAANAVTSANHTPGTERRILEIAYTAYEREVVS